MPQKPKKPQPKTPGDSQGRDLFQTPAYAVDLLEQFLPRRAHSIWEPAAGHGRMARRFARHGFEVYATDLDYPDRYFRMGPDRHGNLVSPDDEGVSFLTAVPWFPFDLIATNPPFSLKEEFARRCMSFGVPWALLIPADQNGWICAALREWRCKILMPTRRIDYICPSGRSGKASSAQFHSMWLTWGIHLPEQTTVVDLTLEMKRTIDPEAPLPLETLQGCA